ncbi:MAG: hypothetical protein HY867_18395 [Chloroflexi bacterium]|nr:hypothetical protein [Chloroflexota bacterium]
MKYNPFRLLFKADLPNATIRVMHVVNPDLQYGRVWLDPQFKAQFKRTFDEPHPMMEELADDLVRDVQRYADRWKLFIVPRTPAEVMKSFIKRRIQAATE